MINAHTEVVIYNFSVKKPEACKFINYIDFATSVRSNEFCKICKNTFFTEHFWATVSICWCFPENVATH